MRQLNELNLWYLALMRDALKEDKPRACLEFNLSEDAADFLLQAPMDSLRNVANCGRALVQLSVDHTTLETLSRPDLSSDVRLAYATMTSGQHCF